MDENRSIAIKGSIDLIQSYAKKLFHLHRSSTDRKSSPLYVGCLMLAAVLYYLYSRRGRLFTLEL